MDFGALAPEINSARMYAGAGSAPLMAAASAWQSLAAELSSAASSYQSVLTSLSSEEWMGPASAAMTAAVEPYVTWMALTAAQAEQSASQASAAAAAFEAAYAMTVPPAAVAANRTQTAALVATNVLGQNTPAITLNEALYGEMWAQDAAAMYGYAAGSAAAAQVSPFTSPAPTTSATGTAQQSAAVTQATGAAASSNIQSALSEFTSTVPSSLQSMAAPAAASPLDYSPVITGGDLANATTNLMSSSFSPMGLAGITQVAADLAVVRGAAISAADPLGLGAIDLPGMGLGPLGAFPATGMSAVTPTNLGGAVLAGVGQSAPVGGLSVPQSWAAATPTGSMATPASFPGAGWTSAAPQAAGAPGMPGLGMTGSNNRSFGMAVPRYGFKPTVMGRPVVAG